MGATDGLTTFLQANRATGRGYASFDLNEAWVSADCPRCNGVQALKVGQALDTVWLRCATCELGFVKNGDTTAPTSLPLRTPRHLPPEDQAVWEEVRQCLGSGAHMAAVMLCRKLLLHLAVAKGLPPENNKGHSPGFEECVKHLQSTGTITQPMLEWVKPIKDIGNTANHKIRAVTLEEATDVANFTHQLLVLAYEMRRTPVPAAEGPAESTS